MRIWSIHPKYLDAKGLLAVWRETLLAQKVLENRTKGYKNHPQLLRFKEQKDALASIGSYLSEIHLEAKKRGYSFDDSKIIRKNSLKLKVTNKQLDYEFQHLKNKLKERDFKKYKEIENFQKAEAHPIFLVIPGEIEKWEKLISSNKEKNK